MRFKPKINFVHRGNFISIGEVNESGELYKKLIAPVNVAIHVRTRRILEDIVAVNFEVLAKQAVLCFSSYVCVIYFSMNVPLVSKQQNLHM